MKNKNLLLITRYTIMVKIAYRKNLPSPNLQKQMEDTTG
jgi:hypothetical protein